MLYVVYNNVLAQVEPERILYLAVTEQTFTDLFEEPIGQLLLNDRFLRLIVFIPKQEEIVRWIH